MNSIKVELQGRLNSFRIPLFKTYHKSFLAPPKTTVIGLLVNLLNKGELGYYRMLEKNNIQISIFIKDIEGDVRDFWICKSLKPSEHGRKPIKRQRLFKVAYLVYLASPEELRREVLSALNSPLSIPALGQDDEMVKVIGAREVNLQLQKSRQVHSVFCNRRNLFYKVKIPSGTKLPIIYPREYSIVTEFDISYKESLRSPRVPRKELPFVEFYNCYLELEREIEVYRDVRENLNLSFY